MWHLDVPEGTRTRLRILFGGLVAAFVVTVYLVAVMVVVALVLSAMY